MFKVSLLRRFEWSNRSHRLRELEVVGCVRDKLSNDFLASKESSVERVKGCSSHS